MKLKHIDLLMVHEPERPGRYDWWANRRDDTEPVIDALDDLKQRGTVGLTGLGGTTAFAMAPIMETGRFHVVLTAFNYRLLWRKAEHAILPAAKWLGIASSSARCCNWAYSRAATTPKSRPDRIG